jgi:UBX domain-containing protein 1/4
LTEEEKKQKLAELRERMAAKRAVKAKQEAEEAKANELIRRKGGQAMAKIQDDLKAKQVAKDLAAKKRGTYAVFLFVLMLQNTCKLNIDCVIAMYR